MSYSDLSEANHIKLPRIAHRSKSLPPTAKNVQREIEYVTAQSWFYCTPHSTYGN